MKNNNLLGVFSPFLLTIGLLLFAIVMVTNCKTQKNSKPKPKQPSSSSSTTKPKPTEAKTGMHFDDSEQLMPLLERAKQEKKLVFIDFTAKWCAPCKMMDENVFSQKSTFEYMNQNFINYRVDVDKANGKTIAGIYEVVSLPTMLFLNGDGIVVEKIVGSASNAQLRNVGDAALAKFK